MKKNLLDFYTKTAFSDDNKFYQQCDEVSISFWTATELANIILIKIDKVVVTPLMESEILIFCCRDVHNTLVLVKEDQIDKVLKALNSFCNNLWFTVDKFENEDVNFLDLRNMNNGSINIYVKDTNSDLHINYNSYEPWHTKTPWIRTLYNSARKICSNVTLSQEQVAHIEKVMSWNGYLRYVQNKIIKRLENRKNTGNNDTLEQQNIVTIFCRISHAEVQRETLTKSRIRKFKKHLDKPSKF